MFPISALLWNVCVTVDLPRRFYVEEKRTQPRLRILEIIDSIMVTQRGLYDEELLELILLPLFSTLHLEHEVAVRERAVELIIAICKHCNSKHCAGLLDILEKIMERPFNLDHGDIVNIPSEEELSDVVKVHHILAIFQLLNLSTFLFGYHPMTSLIVHARTDSTVHHQNVSVAIITRSSGVQDVSATCQSSLRKADLFRICLRNQTCRF